MTILQAKTDRGETHYGAEFVINGHYVYVPLNSVNTPESLEALYQDYLSGRVKVESCMSVHDLFPRSLR